MSTIDKETTAVIVIILIVILAPMLGLIYLTTPEPYKPTTGEPLREAAAAAGIKVLNSTDVTWSLPGALGGKSYVLANDEGKIVIVSTQSFESEATRDAAIRARQAQIVGKGKPMGELIVIGNELVYIHPASGNITKALVPELNKKKQG